jgi:hypothetical protein
MPTIANAAPRTTDSTQGNTASAPIQASYPARDLVKKTASTEMQFGSIALASNNLLASLPAVPPGSNHAKLLEVSGHDDNYTWITGVLIRKPGLPKVWFIHYLPPDAVPDLHRGCVAVQTTFSMEGFREGDLVTVTGYILANVEVAPNQRTTGYAAEHVNHVK